jgi:hypothetical protein
MKYDSISIRFDSPANDYVCVTLQVVLSCGTTGKVLSVEETSRCKYSVKFTTRLACGDGAMDVSNALPPHLLSRLVHLEEDHASGIYTDLGYERGLNEIYRSAGLVSAEEDNSEAISARNDELVRPVAVGDGSVADSSVPEFNSLEECRFAFGALQKMAELTSKSKTFAESPPP